MADKKYRTDFELTATDRATQVFKQVGSGLDELKGKYTGLIAAGGALFAAHGAAAFITDATRYRATIQDIVDTTGDQVRTIDALSRQYRITRGSAEGLDGVLSKLAVNLNNTDEDGKGAAAAVKKIGLNLAELQAMKPGEAFIAISKGLNEYADGDGKLAAGKAILGKAYAQNLPVMKEIAEQQELTAKLTAEEVAQSKELERSWNKLNLEWEDSKQVLASSIIPYLGQMTDQMRELIRLGGGVGGAIRMAFSLGPVSSSMVGEKIAETQAALEKWQRAGAVGRFFQKPLGATYAGTEGQLKNELEFLKFMERQAALEATGPQYLDARDLMARQKPNLNFQATSARDERARQSIGPYAQRMLELQQQAAREEMGGGEFVETQLAIKAGKYKVLDEATGKLRDLTEAEKRLLLQQAAARDTQKNLNEIRQESAKAYEEATKAADDYKRALSGELESMRDLVDPGRVYKRDADRIADMQRVLGISPDEAVRLQRAVFESKNGVKELGEAATTASDAGHALGLSFTSSIERIIFDSGRAVTALDVMRAAALDVAKVIYGRNVAEPLAAGVQGLISSAFAPSWNAGVVGTGMGSLTPHQQDLVGQWLHGGGIVGTDAARTGYIHPAYFENAPRFHDGLMPDEFPAILQKGEGVFTPAQMRSMGGGGDTYYIHAPNSDRAAIAELKAMLAKLGARTAEVSIAELRRRMYRQGKNI